MKKVVAFISMFTIAFVLGGLLTTTVDAASDKWVVDTTLAADEIPVYEMDSIYTTFPNYYDNAAKADPNWGGSARMYPWNETRLRVAQFDENGNATGKYYAVYFSGSTTALNSAGDPVSGAGNNLLFYDVDKEGNMVLTRMDGGKINESGNQPMDPSLSHMRTNISDKDFILNSEINADEANRLYNRGVVFDGQGRMIWGISGDATYDPAAETGVGREFCFVDGVATKYVEGMECDKALVPDTDEEGNPKLDEEGNPIMVETDAPAFVGSRFVWYWSETAQPTNEVGYLQTGWDAMKWDLSWAQDEGFMHVAFTGSAGSYFKLKADQLEVYKATCEAAGLEAPTEATFRKMCRDIPVPAKGITFDFGYLDWGTACQQVFTDMIVSGYRYGRVSDYAVGKTYNFSTTGLKVRDVVRDNNSYQLLDGQNVVEIMAGDTFNPAENINYMGLASMWKTADDFTSYTKDTSNLDFTITTNGDIEVFRYPYADKAEMIADFEKDVRAFFVSKGKTEDKFINFTVSKTQDVGWDFIGTSQSDSAFWGVKANRDKWAWMINYVKGVRAANGLSTGHWDTIDQGMTASPGTFNAEVQAFLTNVQLNPGAWNRTSDYTIEENANGFLPKKSNLELWNEYAIDTTDLAVNTCFTVEFKVANLVTGSSDKVVIKFVVVDEYTPILKINEDELLIQPTVGENGKVNISAINKYALTEAFDAKYNGSDILGNSINYKVQYTSDTLDFDNPKEGTHRVTATVANHFKSVTKQFTVRIVDVTAPVVEVKETVNVQYGSDFDFTDGIVYAYDAVDGDLMNRLGLLAVDISSNPIDTTKVGKQTVKLEVYDTSSNAKAVQYTVVVSAAPATGDELGDLDEALNGRIDGLEDLISQIKDELTKTITDATASGCKKSSAYFVEFLAAAGLLLLVLRKKNS